MVLDLSVNVRKEKEVPIIDISGEIDVYTYPRLSETLNEILENEVSNLVLNLEEVKYIDSTGLGVIANGANKIAKNNGYVHIINANPQVKKIFEVSGLAQANFKLYDKDQFRIEDLEGGK
jgi:anti-sigma B factor antagonist